MRECSIANCQRPARGRGWCSKHYMRWWNHGDPLKTCFEKQFAIGSPTRAQLYWAAGFLEGEGHFSANRGNGCEHISAAQRDPAPLNALRLFFGGTIRPKRAGVTVGASFVWKVNGARARGVMMTLYPMLWQKQPCVSRALQAKLGPLRLIHGTGRSDLPHFERRR